MEERIELFTSYLLGQNETLNDCAFTILGVNDRPNDTFGATVRLRCSTEFVEALKVLKKPFHPYYGMGTAWCYKVGEGKEDEEPQEDNEPTQQTVSGDKGESHTQKP